MNVRYALHAVDFEWDETKAAKNWQKHGIDLETACQAFFDPFVCYVDEQVVGSELRERLVGLTTSWLLLLVAYVLRDDVIRIISARLVTKAERKIYENQ